MTSTLSAPHFHNEGAAYAYVEARLWPNGPVCPHCGAEGDRIGRLAGESTRIGLRKCYGCRKQFTVKIGTIFEDSHAPLRLWLQAVYLMCSSKKGISTRQLQRTLGVGMKTAWHMGHRIRLAMEPSPSSGPMGGEGKVVEADETFLTKFSQNQEAPWLPAQGDDPEPCGAGRRTYPVGRSGEAAEQAGNRFDPATPRPSGQHSAHRWRAVLQAQSRYLET